MNRAQLHVHLTGAVTAAKLSRLGVVIDQQMAEAIVVHVIDALEQLTADYVLDRCDGDELWGEYAQMLVAGLDDWEPAERYADEQPGEFRIRRLIAIDTRTRTFPSPPPQDGML